MEKRLHRSQSDRMIWGVCGGLAKYLDVDPSVIRVITVLLVFASGIGLLAYIIMTIMVPLEGSKPAQITETMRDNVGEMRETAGKLGEDVRSAFGAEPKAEDRDRIRQRRRNFVGGALIVMGILFLIANFGVMWWFRWAIFWPIFLIIIGLLVITSMRGKSED